MKSSIAMLLVAFCTLGTGAGAQNHSSQPSTASCPLAVDISPVHLYGLWRADFEGLPQGATLQLERHAELAGSVSGSVNRDGVKALVAGDVDRGEFTLEESLDGQGIAATWLGSVVEGSCGKEVRGIWNNTSNNGSYPFVLRKQPGWQ